MVLKKQKNTNFPATKAEAIRRGYKLSGCAKCKGCGVPLEWYVTPGGRWMPISDPSTFKPHWEECPNQAELRDKIKRD